MNTCDKCRHYTPSDEGYPNDFRFAGRCAMMGDSNGQSPVVAINRAAGWDYEGYRSGVYVGPKFGCIHFEARATP